MVALSSPRVQVIFPLLVITEPTTQLSPSWLLWSSMVILASLAPRFTKVVTLSFLARVSMSPPSPRQMALMSADFPLLNNDHEVMQCLESTYPLWPMTTLKPGAGSTTLSV